MIGWLDDEYIAIDNSGLNFMAAGFRYGVNLFDALRVSVNILEEYKEYHIFRLNLHIERFLEGCKVLGIELKYSSKDIENIILNVISKNELREDFGIRIFTFLNSKKLISEDEIYGLLVFPISLELVNLDRDYILTSFPLSKNKDNILPANVKCTSHYVKSRVAIKMQKKAGDMFDDLIYFNSLGNILETSKANIFIVKKGEILTPPKGEILEGITRKSVIDLVNKHPILSKYDLYETPLKFNDLKNADEVFLTSTSIGISSVQKIDSKIYGNKVVTNKISNILKGLYRVNNPWITTIKITKDKEVYHL